jgi:glycosyltransferase involved in cell wall biosynthesis
MRIALVTPGIPPIGGGIATAIMHLALGLSRLGHEVTMITCLEPTPTRRERTIGGLHVVSLPTSRYPATLARATNRAVRTAARRVKHDDTVQVYAATRAALGVLAARKICAELAHGDFHIVGCPEFGGGCEVFTRPMGAAVRVAWLHGSGYSELSRYGRDMRLLRTDVRLSNWLERRGVLAADLRTAPTCEAARDGEQWLTEGREVVVARNCVDLEYLDAIEPAHIAGDSEGEVVRVAVVGLIHALKGSHDVESVMGILGARRDGPTYQFVFIGQDLRPGSALGQCEGRKSRVQVCATGGLGYPETIATLKSCHVFLQPSHTETFSMTVLEALACNVPTVSTRVGAVADMIPDETHGLVREVGDVASLARGLEQLGEPAARWPIALKARRRVEQRFASDVVADEWLRLVGDAKLPRTSARDRGAHGQTGLPPVASGRCR